MDSCHKTFYMVNSGLLFAPRLSQKPKIHLSLCCRLILCQKHCDRKGVFLESRLRLSREVAKDFRKRKKVLTDVFGGALMFGPSGGEGSVSGGNQAYGWYEQREAMASPNSKSSNCSGGADEWVLVLLQMDVIKSFGLRKRRKPSLSLEWWCSACPGWCGPWRCGAGVDGVQLLFWSVLVWPLIKWGDGGRL